MSQVWMDVLFIADAVAVWGMILLSDGAAMRKHLSAGIFGWG